MEKAEHLPICCIFNGLYLFHEHHLVHECCFRSCWLWTDEGCRCRNSSRHQLGAITNCPGLKRDWKKWVNYTLPNCKCNHSLVDGNPDRSALHLSLLSISLVSNNHSLRMMEWPVLILAPPSWCQPILTNPATSISGHKHVRLPCKSYHSFTVSVPKSQHSIQWGG